MESINICYWGSNGNWGDEVNKIICSKISGKAVNKISTEEEAATFRYYCIGSILQSAKSNNFEVWGTGLMHSNGRLPYAPNKIHAVRGPLTRDLLLKQGFDCPEIYGDPALLYPMFYKPNIKEKYRFGIIPHYVDFSDPWVQKFSNNPDVKIINIKDRTCNKFIDDIHECEILLSSSLHGIIAGDAYGIPSYWIELSNKVHGKGFKFKDYFLSVKRPLVEPIRPKLETNIKDFSNTFYDYKIDIDLEKLMQACPFKK